MENELAGGYSTFPRVPPGRHGLPRQFVADHQRRRLMAAMADLVAKRGYRKTSLSRLCSAAGVASNTFYELFESKDACFLATFDDAVAQMTVRVSDAIESDSTWPEQATQGLAAFLSFAEQEPQLARLMIVEAMTAGPAAVARYEAAVDSLVPVFGAGRELAGTDIPSTMEETVIRGMLWIFYQRLTLNEPLKTPELLRDLIAFALAPYLGDAEAGRAAAAAAELDPA